MCLNLKLGLSSSDFEQTYKRSARNLMVRVFFCSVVGDITAASVVRVGCYRKPPGAQPSGAARDPRA
eukprot:4584818-Heterocapsa_arctica.AAC.1